MHGAGARYLIALAVTVAVAAGASADAETYKRVTPEGATYVAAAHAAPIHRRAALMPEASRGQQGTWSPDGYARMIAEASAQHAVPERLIWAVIRVESGF